MAQNTTSDAPPEGPTTAAAKRTVNVAVGDIVPPRDRGRYQGVFGGVFGASSVLGPLLGGVFVDNLSWRWVFYINLPIGLIALAVIASVLHIPARRTTHRIDYLGMAAVA